MENSLKKVLNEIFIEKGLDNSDNNLLIIEFLKSYKDELLKFDEFKDVEEIIIMDSPSIKNDNGEIIQTKHYRLTENFKLKGKVYLYNILFTPPICDMKDFYKEVKNGCSITHTMYDSTNFDLCKQIRIKFNPWEENVKGKLHKLLDDILDNPQEYEVKKSRDIIFVGIFDYINDKEIKQDLENLNNDKFKNQCKSGKCKQKKMNNKKNRKLQ